MLFCSAYYNIAYLPAGRQVILYHLRLPCPTLQHFDKLSVQGQSREVISGSIHRQGLYTPCFCMALYKEFYPLYKG